MPEWLQKTENYSPGEDRGAFIDRSILSFLGLLARIRAQDAQKDPFQVNAFFRVLFTLMLIVFISLSETFSFIYLTVAYLLLLLCLLPGKQIFRILRVCLITALFTAVILLPAAFYGNTYSIVIVPVKVFVSVLAVNILSHATRWDQLTLALKRFRLPDLLIFILDITLKYIVMLGEFTVMMLYALKLRSVGRNKNKVGALSGVAGTMFLKSREMAEELHSAMECRGFSGEYRIYQKFKIGFADAGYLLLNAGIVYLFITLYRGRV